MDKPDKTSTPPDDKKERQADPTPEQSTKGPSPGLLKAAKKATDQLNPAAPPQPGPKPAAPSEPLLKGAPAGEPRDTSTDVPRGAPTGAQPKKPAPEPEESTRPAPGSHKPTTETLNTKPAAPPQAPSTETNLEKVRPDAADRPPSRRDRLMDALKVDRPEAVQPWQVILQALTPEGEVVGAEIRRISVIGRADKSNLQPDMDLSHLDKGKSGVSRQHAVLLPADDGLYLIDLDSTNGTWVNGLYLQPGHKHRLNTGDVIEFGTLKMLTRVVGTVTGTGDQGPDDPTTAVARSKPRRR
jgi:hypothetical protein